MPQSFAEFFDGSYVKNLDGSPMVAFHGTKATIDQFKTPTWLSNREDYADLFSADWGDGERTPESKVYPVYLAFKNPYFTSNWGVTEGKANSAEWRAAREAEGYDSVIFSLEGEVEFIAFHPDQIMHATDPRAPQSRFSNYSGPADLEGMRIAEPDNSLLFTQPGPWRKDDDGALVRSVASEEPDSDDLVAVVSEGRIFVMHNEKEVAAPEGLDLCDAQEWCDRYLIAAGAVVPEPAEPAPILRRRGP
jgi:hypothetical protein